MPEGDTVHLAASRMQAALAEAPLTESDFRVPSYATVDLTGRRVLEVCARGKHMLTRFEGALSLHTHFKMDGSWHLYGADRSGRASGHELRVVLANDTYTAVGRRLAIVDLLPTVEETRVVGHLGPDPLGPDWDASVALDRLRAGPGRSISEALLDQRVMAGLGNVYRCEICFLRGIHPLTPVGEVDDLEGVVDLAARLLEANRLTGNQITTGDARPARRQWVYGRRGRPCARCGTPISRSAAGHVDGETRVTYWCPRCQPR